MHAGFVGTGNMGSPMAANVLKAGHRLTVYDVRPEATTELERLGAERPAALPALARAVRATLLSLPNERVVEAVVLGAPGAPGLVEGAQRGDVIFDLSTVSPTSTRPPPLRPLARDPPQPAPARRATRRARGAPDRRARERQRERRARRDARGHARRDRRGGRPLGAGPPGDRHEPLLPGRDGPGQHPEAPQQLRRAHRPGGALRGDGARRPARRPARQRRRRARQELGRELHPRAQARGARRARLPRRLLRGPRAERSRPGARARRRGGRARRGGARGVAGLRGGERARLRRPGQLGAAQAARAPGGRPALRRRRDDPPAPRSEPRGFAVSEQRVAGDDRAPLPQALGEAETALLAPDAAVTEERAGQAARRRLRPG